jgi:hypothetical protein
MPRQKGVKNAGLKSLKERNMKKLHRALTRHVDTDELVKTVYRNALGIYYEKADKDTGTKIIYQEKPDKDSARLLFEQKFGKPAQQIDLNEKQQVFHNFKAEDLKRMDTGQLLTLIHGKDKKNKTGT